MKTTHTKRQFLNFAKKKGYKNIYGAYTVNQRWFVHFFKVNIKTKSLIYEWGIGQKFEDNILDFDSYAFDDLTLYEDEKEWRRARLLNGLEPINQAK